MCKHGTTTTLLLPTPDVSDPAGLRYTMRLWPIDSCIAPLVAALNTAGIATRGSCCGHGKAAGAIVLTDGRWLVLTSREAAIASDLPHVEPLQWEALRAVLPVKP